MRRTILLSLVVISAALAVVFGAGTFAAFTDESTVNGTVSSAVIDVVANGDTTDGDPTVTSFTFLPQDLLPDEESTGTFTLHNDGTRAFDLGWDVTITDDVAGACASFLTVKANGITVTDTANDDHPANTDGEVHMLVNATETFSITVVLAGNTPSATCQGVVFTVTVDLEATGVADSHP